MTDRRARLLVRLAIVSTVLAVGGAALALNVLADGGDSGPFGGQPLPALFPSARLALVHAPEAAELARAKRDFASFDATNPTRDDKAFAAFALAHVGAPPSGARQQAELAVLHDAGAHRTPQQNATAAWLENHGKKDVWKLYRKQAADFLPAATGDAAKATFKDAYALAGDIADAGKAHFARPSPYITDPSLHALNQSRFTKKFSYPSKHTVIGYALSGVLAHYEPSRIGEYRWMSEEISYSRVYAGGHYVSDIAAGVYLGDLIALYELRHPPAAG